MKSILDEKKEAGEKNRYISQKKSRGEVIDPSPEYHRPIRPEVFPKLCWKKQDGQVKKYEVNFHSS
jgi:hypothetical protein